MQSDAEQSRPDSNTDAPSLKSDFEHAEAAWKTVPAEATALHRIAADSDQPLLERVEAFEDLIDAEVGHEEVVAIGREGHGGRRLHLLALGIDAAALVGDGCQPFAQPDRSAAMVAADEDQQRGPPLTASGPGWSAAPALRR